MIDSIYTKLELLNSVTLNFNSSSLLIMNITIAFIMFGVALNIKVQDFRNLRQNPKALITGIVSQFLLLPAVTFLVIVFTDLPAAIGLGMLLVASCPGGNVSNFITSLSKGNVALSVSLTAISDLSSIIMTPLNFTFWGNLYLGTLPLAHPITIPFSQVMETILLLMAIPLFLGMFFAYKFPKTTKKLTKPIKTISLIAFFGFVIGALLNNFDLFLEHIIFIIPIVLIHNLLAFTTGWSAARAVGLSRNDRKTITIETGIQNSGLALILFFNHKIFPEGYGGVAFIAAWWGIWHIISGLILSQFFKRDKKKEVQKELA